MGLDIEKLASQMQHLLSNVTIQERILTLTQLKEDIYAKKELLQKWHNELSKLESGKYTYKLLKEVEQIMADFNVLYENFDDKLMLFIIGNGNVGKSTLINALAGETVAPTNFLPNTWKIDVYSPEIAQDKGLIKYVDGKQELKALQQVKDKVKQEEDRSRESKKKYTEEVNKVLKEIKIKEEREEMKRYLAEKHLYKSNISEVRWPVKKNWLLETCLLVDTPGLNQNLNDIKQLGSIHDYYHKADGVLWLLDAQTIASANAKKLFEELDDVLGTVGGVRDNIIGVINRIDLVRKNGGDTAVESVYKDAKKIFGNNFTQIIPVSAQQACQGDLTESGLIKLQDAIRDIFISKADSVKNNAKTQGHMKLVGMTSQILNKYKQQIIDYETVYQQKKKQLQEVSDKLRETLKQALDSFFEQYMQEVSKRVDVHIDALGEGEGVTFIKDKMYQLDTFLIRRDTWIKNKELEMQNTLTAWEKFSRISEYKYIDVSGLSKVNKVSVNVNLNLNQLDNIAFFAPSLEEDLFSLIGNVLGKAMFWMRKGGIKNNINQTLKQECDKMNSDIMEQFEKCIVAQVTACTYIMNETFKDILFDVEQIERVEASIDELQAALLKEKGKIELKNIVL